jgi:hypothetical protein
MSDQRTCSEGYEPKDIIDAEETVLIIRILSTIPLCFKRESTTYKL